MQFTNVIFNTYDVRISSDSLDIYLHISSYKSIYFNQLKFLNFSIIAIISAVYSYLKGD
jgi:hypothetical protein